MMGIGDNVSQGLAVGITGGEGDVEDAAKGAGMAAIAGVGAGAAQAGSGGAPRAGTNGKRLEVKVEAGAVVIHGAGGDVMALTEEALALLLERVALKAGL
jgi:predicted nicotinamide N-methyase